MDLRSSIGSLAVGLVISSFALAAPPEAKKVTAAKPATKQTSPPATKEQQKPQAKVKISKETTYITEPLRADGYPDYVAALNQRFSQGVTPENNSAVLFWRAIGPKEISEKHREKYFQMLGMTAPAEKGEYFVDLYEYVLEKRKAAHREADSDALAREVNAQHEQVLSRPWSQKEFPLFAEALRANEKPLALLVEASERPRRYDPLVSDNDTVLGAFPWAIQSHRRVATALLARAMLRMHEEKGDEAWSDLMACHRLARLVGQGPTLVEALVAMTIDVVAFGAERSILIHAALKSQQILRMRDDLSRLPPPTEVVRLIEVSERFWYLDLVMISMKRLSEGARLSYEIQLKGAQEWLIDNVLSRLIDWEVVLVLGNASYDRLAAILSVSPIPAKRTALENFTRELRQTRERADLRTRGAASLLNPSKIASEWIGEVLKELVLSNVAICAQAEDRGAMNLELTKLAFSLAAYRADHGSYPEKLSELVTKYTKEVPKDIFNDAELHYSRPDGGYLLYSVGVNGKDDGGKTYSDRKDNEDYDDLVVRMPGRKP